MTSERSGRFSSKSRMADLFQLMSACHQEPDLLGRHLTGGISFRELAARNDGDAVGDLEDLVEILADHQDCRSAAGKIDQRLADSRRGTGIDAPGRLVDDQNRRRAVKLAA